MTQQKPRRCATPVTLVMAEGKAAAANSTNTIAKKMALSGNVAFISQSGALCMAILDWSLREKVGFSAAAGN